MEPRTTYAVGQRLPGVGFGVLTVKGLRVPFRPRSAASTGVKGELRKAVWYPACNPLLRNTSRIGGGLYPHGDGLARDRMSLLAGTVAVLVKAAMGHRPSMTIDPVEQCPPPARTECGV